MSIYIPDDILQIVWCKVPLLPKCKKFSTLFFFSIWNFWLWIFIPCTPWKTSSSWNLLQCLMLLSPHTRCQPSLWIRINHKFATLSAFTLFLHDKQWLLVGTKFDSTLPLVPEGVEYLSTNLWFSLPVVLYSPDCEALTHNTQLCGHYFILQLSYATLIDLFIVLTQLT